MDHRDSNRFDPGFKVGSAEFMGMVSTLIFFAMWGGICHMTGTGKKAL